MEDRFGTLQVKLTHCAMSGAGAEGAEHDFLIFLSLNLCVMLRPLRSSDSRHNTVLLAVLLQMKWLMAEYPSQLIIIRSTAKQQPAPALLYTANIPESRESWMTTPMGPVMVSCDTTHNLWAGGALCLEKAAMLTNPAQSVC